MLRFATCHGAPLSALAAILLNTIVAIDSCFSSSLLRYRFSITLFRHYWATGHAAMLPALVAAASPLLHCCHATILHIIHDMLQTEASSFHDISASLPKMPRHSNTQFSVLARRHRWYHNIASLFIGYYRATRGAPQQASSCQLRYCCQRFRRVAFDMLPLHERRRCRHYWVDTAYRRFASATVSCRFWLLNAIDA